MPLPATDPEQRLLDLIEMAEPSIRNALMSAVVATRDSVTLELLAELIESGQFQEALETAARAGAIRLSEDVAAVYILSGRDTAEFLTEVLEVTVGFDVVNERAVNYLQQERFRLISGFTQEQIAATQLALVNGTQRGLNPLEQARNFRDSIGLTANQVAAVENYRRLLESGTTEALTRELRDRRFDSTVRRAAETGEPLTQAQINRMTQRYNERMLAFRANTIARTESLRAVHAGADEGYLQAIDQGFISRPQLRRKWNTARDERVRSSHVRLNGLVRGIDETFPGDEGELKFPGDPDAPAAETVQCRCVLSTRIDEP